MLIDLHIHSEYSFDCTMTLKEIIAEAKRKGLDAICITDHENSDSKKQSEKLSKELGYPVFVGVEYLTNSGDIIAIGIDEIPNEKIDAQEFLDLVKSQGGVCISAHPYRNNNRGLEDKLKEVNNLTGIEVLNGSTDELSNKKAFETAKELNIQGIGSSDAHEVHLVGKYATLLPFRVKTTEDLIKAIKSNECKPAIYKDDKYIIVDK